MADEGTSFSIDIPVTGGSGIDAAAASVDSLAVRLDKATKASQASSDAVKAAEASYSKAEANVDKFTKALERVGVAADAQKAKLRVATDLGDTSAVSRANAQIKELASQHEQLAGKVSNAKTVLAGEAKILDMLKSKSVGEGETNFEKLERGLRRLGGPVEAIGDPILKMASGWKKVTAAVGENGALLAGAAITLALAAAVVAVTVALGEGIVKIGIWAVQLADARTNALGLAAGMVRSKADGQILSDQIDQLTKKFPLTQEEISATAKELAGMGLRGDALAGALERSAERAARIKFGPAFAEQMLTLGEQSKVFQVNLAQTFGGLDTSGLMRALQTMVSLFDSSTESGRALQVVFNSIFQPLIDTVAGARVKVEAFFLHLEIWALEALTAIKPFGSLIVKVGEVFLIGAAIIGGVFATALAVVVGLVGLFVLGIGAVVTGFIKLNAWASSLGDKIYDTFSGIDLVAVGKSLIQGLADGVVAGGKALVDAVEGAARQAIAAAKGVLGIHSPSTVFAEIGMQTGAGMAVGVDRSAPAVGDALERMTSPPSASPGSAQVAGGGEASGGGGRMLNLQGAQFVFNGVEGAEDAESRFSALLTQMVHGDAVQIGGMAAATPTG
jgi:hypothetical protein